MRAGGGNAEYVPEPGGSLCAHPGKNKLARMMPIIAEKDLFIAVLVLDLAVQSVRVLDQFPLRSAIA